jgi:7-cyano-7-deazaguanine synthase
MEKNERVLLILSGGLDSAVLLAKLSREGKDIYALSFDYGQKHKKELECAKKLSEHYGVIQHEIIKIPILYGSALTDEIHEIPEGHYESESMKATVVPNRNMIMLSLACAFAEANDISKVYYGAHSGDHHIYWDCRKEFIEAINDVLLLNDNVEDMEFHGDNKKSPQGLQVIAPFINLDKGDIACIGKALNVPFELTYSCYKGQDIPCGKCGSCVERAEAFSKAGWDNSLRFEYNIDRDL